MVSLSTTALAFGMGRAGGLGSVSKMGGLGGLGKTGILGKLGIIMLLGRLGLHGIWATGAFFVIILLILAGIFYMVYRYRIRGYKQV